MPRIVRIKMPAKNKKISLSEFIIRMFQLPGLSRKKPTFHRIKSKRQELCSDGRKLI